MHCLKGRIRVCSLLIALLLRSDGVALFSLHISFTCASSHRVPQIALNPLLAARLLCTVQRSVHFFLFINMFNILTKEFEYLKNCLKILQILSVYALNFLKNILNILLKIL